MIVFGCLVVAFAWVVTVHLSIVIGLAFRHPRWHAAVAFIFPLAGPYWAWQEKMRVRAGMWIGGLVVYLVALLLSRA